MNLFLQALALGFGLMPFKREQLTETNIVMDYSLIAITPLFYLFCYYYANFQGYSIISLDECNNICKVISKLLMHIGCFIYIYIYLLTLVRRKGFYVEYARRLDDIDKLLKQCINLAESGEKKLVIPQKKRMFYAIWAFVIVIFGLAIFYDVYEVFKYYGPFCIMSNMVITFPFVAGSIVQGMFISYVSTISERFRILNILFEKINEESDKKNAPIAIISLENDAQTQKRTIRNRIGLQQTKRRNRKSNEMYENDDSDFAEASDSANESYHYDDYNGATRVPSSGKTSEANLPSLFKLHDKILSLSVVVNGEFGLQCVPYFAACFIITILGIFLETKVMFIVRGRNEVMDYAIYLYVIWSFATMIIAYLVLRLCCNANANSKQSAMIVHEIMQKKPAFMLNNDIYYNKMKSFTLQFLHWEGYFHFNGVGLFSLDYTFIFSTVSAATSYLIVLLQFDMTPILKNEGLLTNALPFGTN